MNQHPPDDFLADAETNWPRLPDDQLSGLSDEEKNFIRGMEDHVIAGEYAMLSEIIRGCHNKFQFAKTYKLLRADLRNTFADPNAGNPSYSPLVNQAMRQAFMKVGTTKLDYMAKWFFTTMADASDTQRVMACLNKGEWRVEAALEPYIGNEDESGCKKYSAALLALIILTTLLVGGLVWHVFPS